MAGVIRIATRASRLALWQAEHVRELLRQQAGVEAEIVHVRTEGDRNQSDPLRQFGGTGVFTREVQRSVLDEETDIAVHSLKDLQTEPTQGLVLAAVPSRAPTADAVLLPAGAEPVNSLDDLADGARIGTGSPRRQAQLLHRRPDLRMLEIRGNVETRIRKLDEGEFDAIVLAEAGLMRLGLDNRISLRLVPPQVYAAVGQGALGLECREDDASTRELLSRLTDPTVLSCVLAERSLLATLRAGCHAPLGVASELKADLLGLTAVLLTIDGKTRHVATSSGPAADPQAVGRTVAQQLLDAGARVE
ncbi:MAG: hydroxymethylbilane synthase [Planctomycetaceae bacterium]|nr:hydroxymethylbilane synthase [Planctomycetaceae bacterium]